MNLNKNDYENVWHLLRSENVFGCVQTFMTAIYVNVCIYVHIVDVLTGISQFIITIYKTGCVRSNDNIRDVYLRRSEFNINILILLNEKKTSPRRKVLCGI